MTDKYAGLVYLELDDVLEIDTAIIHATAAQAADYLRSADALQGALGRPQTYAHYERADLALQAAVLAHGIAETQPFIDGNKRTALVAMLTSSSSTITGSRRAIASSPIGSSASAAGPLPQRSPPRIDPT